MNEHVLLVEDDASLRESTALVLERSGMQVQQESEGNAGLAAFGREQFDVVLLDVMLPGMDGLEICRTIRQDSQVPLIMLTAKADPTDAVLGLELGADDYVTKPFDDQELVARINAVLRRTQVTGEQKRLVKGDLVVDAGAHSVTLAEQDIPLSATEFRLLYELAANAGQVLTREALLERVWHYDYMGDSRMVDMAIKRLRSKLDDDPTVPQFIETVRGVGYRFRNG